MLTGIAAGIGLLALLTSPIWLSAIAHTVDQRRRERNGWDPRE